MPVALAELGELAILFGVLAILLTSHLLVSALFGAAKGIVNQKAHVTR